MDLRALHCRPLPEGTPPLRNEALLPYLAAVSTRWKVLEDHHLEGKFDFPDFLQALAFTNRAGAIAEVEDHHPEILLTWGQVTVRIWTHSIGGLSENDFILAERLDRVAGS